MTNEQKALAEEIRRKIALLSKILDRETNQDTATDFDSDFSRGLCAGLRIGRGVLEDLLSYAEREYLCPISGGRETA